MSIFCRRPLHRFVLGAMLLLSGCGPVGSGGSKPPPPGPAMINPIEYLVGSQHCDGNVITPLHQNDPITCRRFDFGHYQASEAFLLPDGSTIVTWSYDPWGPFDVSRGDGGEHYVIDGPTVRIESTQDGGKPGVVQYFVGANWGDRVDRISR
jgi:hypothetical protein